MAIRMRDQRWWSVWRSDPVNDDRAGGRSKFSVRDVLADMEAQGLSPRTRQQARAILRIALGAAVEDGLIAANAAVSASA